MSKWRPASECLYVIPDIHGQLFQLELILSRILPLRKNKGVKDRIIFLGDYIDRGKHSPQVLDRIIELKKKYNDQVITILGNHELMLLDAIELSEKSNRYLFWMKNGGEHTLSSYLDRANHHLDNPYVLDRKRVGSFIPKEHLEFINQLAPYYETDDFIFVHGGCVPDIPLEIQSPQILAWDRALFNYLRNNPSIKPTWEKCIVTGHNGDTGKPYITPKFMMLDCSCDNKLLVLELNSMQGFVAESGNKKMNKLEF